MLYDAQEIAPAERLKFDVCIIGCGVAGTTLASALDKSGLSVGVLESGSLDPDRSTQALYEGENVGLPYYPLHTARSRQFGGSSNRWLLELGDGSIGARLAPLDSIDFEKRSWVPDSGWPFGLDELRPYYTRAGEFLELSPAGYREPSWRSDPPYSGIDLGDSSFVTKVYQCCRRDVFLERCRRQFEESANVSVYLNLNVLEIVTDDTGENVCHVDAATLAGTRFRVRASVFVLATGAIECARLMLLSRRHQPHGLGNTRDLVGRYFMEHPHLWEGVLIPSDRELLKHSRFYSTHINTDGFPIIGQLCLTEEAQRSRELLNHAMVLKAAPKTRRSLKQYPLSGGVTAVKDAARAAVRGDLEQMSRHLSTVVPVAGAASIRLYRRVLKMSQKIVDLRRDRVFRLNHMVEQVPNSSSRVMLGDQVDVFGQPKVQLHWTMCDQDLDSIQRVIGLLDNELRASSVGEVQSLIGTDNGLSDIHGGWHHMGTTRMHNDPGLGVTDGHGRVHGVTNLFVSGSSTFPTSGSANPTLTIIALAIRLADDLKRRLAPPDLAGRS